MSLCIDLPCTFASLLIIVSPSTVFSVCGTGNGFPLLPVFSTLSLLLSACFSTKTVKKNHYISESSITRTKSIIDLLQLDEQEPSSKYMTVYIFEFANLSNKTILSSVNLP